MRPLPFSVVFVTSSPIKRRSNLTDIDDLELPDWAVRHHFLNHSPSGCTRPDDLEFFEKVVARPARVFNPFGIPAVAGTIAHDYATDVIVKGVEQAEAFRHAVSRLDEYTPRPWIEKDDWKHNVIRESIYAVPKSDPKVSGTVFELTLEHLLQGVREATAGSNVVEEGKWASIRFNGLTLPTVGQLDLQDRGVIEMKTKWPRNSNQAKKGWGPPTIPKTPDPDHVMQVAFYWRWMREQSENVPVKLIYAGCNGYRVFDSANEPLLSEASMSAALDHMRKVARKREIILQACATRDQLFEMVTPNFKDWKWNNVRPEYFKLACQVWGV